MSAPVVIIGCGLAGLAVALTLAPRPVIVLARRAPGEWTSSGWAQGGVAAALGADDSPARHAADTLAAGAGLCDPAIAQLVAEAAPGVIAQLASWGVAFDRAAEGSLKLGLEGAHSRRRIVHAQGDCTGAAIMQALVARAREQESVALVSDVEVTRLETDDRGLSAVAFRSEDGQSWRLPTRQVVLATGGVGALWRDTTNPPGSAGQGLALAARAGAALRDLEFVQFHPTAMDVGRDPMPLASEALRGEGATLMDAAGHRIVPDDLAPRDSVARAVAETERNGSRAFLDVRRIERVAARFPALHGACVAAGIDPQTTPIPIRPAAHYHMGGVAVNAEGQSAVDGLSVCGEVAATGLHGANRLASNSLLEAVVFGQRIARRLMDEAPPPSGESPSRLAGLAEASATARTEPPEAIAAQRALMARHVGVARDQEGLEAALVALAPACATSNRALAAFMIARAAWERQESRGAHSRRDFPGTAAAPATLTGTLRWTPDGVPTMDFTETPLATG